MSSVLFRVDGPIMEPFKSLRAKGRGFLRYYPIRYDLRLLLNQLRRDGHRILFYEKERNSGVGAWLQAAARARSVLNLTLRGLMEPGDRLVFKGDELAARADVIVSDGPEGVRILRGGLESIAQDGSELYREIGRLLAGEPGFPVIGRADRLRLTPDEARRYNERLKEQLAYTPYERRAQKRREWTYRAVVGLCRPVLKRVYPHSVVNADAIPSERGLLFLSNHVGESDVPILLSLLRRPVHFLAKVEMAEGRRGRFLNAIGHIFVDRDRPDSRASAQMTITRILANGGDVLVFPEGTINRTDEFLGLFHAGAFRSAQISGASIVPIVVLRDSERKRVIVSSERIHVSLGDDLDEARDRLRSIMLREMARDKPTMTAL